MYVLIIFISTYCMCIGEQLIGKIRYVMENIKLPLTCNASCIVSDILLMSVRFSVTTKNTLIVFILDDHMITVGSLSHRLVSL